MGKRFNLRCIHFSGNIFRLCFLGKYNRNIKIFGYDTGNTNTRRLDRQDLVDLLTLKTAFKLLADLLEQMNIHLVIQETIHFQYISCSYDSIFTDSVV